MKQYKENDLPEGWGSAPIKILATLKKGKIPNKVDKIPWPGAVPYIDIEAFEKGNIRRYADPKASTLVDEGEIIIVWDGARCGHTGKVPKSGALGSTLGIITPILIHPDYILRFLQLSYDTINTNPRGIGIPHVEPELFWNLEVPLAPFAEQKRIVAKVEELLARVNATKERLAKVSLIFKRFRQAVLAAACSGRLTEDWRVKYHTDHSSENGELPTGWYWMKVGELLPPRGIFDGPFGSNLKTADYTNEGVRVIRLENIGHLHFINEKETYISCEKYQTLTKHTVGYGDIIFASFMDEEVRACVLPKLETKAIAKADCFCLRPREDVVDRHYLALQVVSWESYERLSENIHGATRPRINITQLRNLEVRVCPLPEQHEIVRRVEAMFKLADTVEKRVETAKLRAEKLTQTILAKAFRGELVPTEAELARREGRSYEPASNLLARIKAERESKESSQKVRRSRK
jgi:type I restriction enzyme S subunit